MKKDKEKDDNTLPAGSSEPLSNEDRGDGRRADGTYVKGFRANPNGRPFGSVDPLKEIGRKIAEERIADGLSIKQRRRLVKMGVKVEDLSVVEHIMRDWAFSNSAIKQEKYIERTFGKVPNVNINSNSSFDWMRHSSKFTDAELEAIKDGADPLEIYSSKIPDVETVEEVITRIKNGDDALQVLVELIPGIFNVE